MFERGTHLLGIKYWAQWYSISGPPKYDLYLYVGRDKDKGVFYFKHRTTGALMTKGTHQLDYYGFKPFVLDFRAIALYLEGVKNGTTPIST
jgi:hypothetical protein